jgi:hypothetical protein
LSFKGNFQAISTIQPAMSVGMSIACLVAVKDDRRARGLAEAIVGRGAGTVSARLLSLAAAVVVTSPHK